MNFWNRLTQNKPGASSRSINGPSRNNFHVNFANPIPATWDAHIHAPWRGRKQIFWFPMGISCHMTEQGKSIGFYSRDVEVEQTKRAKTKTD